MSKVFSIYAAKKGIPFFSHFARNVDNFIFQQWHSVVFLSIIILSLICPSAKAQIRSEDEPLRLTGHENHNVTLSYAANLTKNFRVKTGATTTTILAEYFGKDALQQVLDEPGCIGLRIYYGQKDDGTPALVLIGVDQSGNDMIKGFVLENGYPCPPICDVEGFLIQGVPKLSLSALTGLQK